MHFILDRAFSCTHCTHVRAVVTMLKAITILSRKFLIIVKPYESAFITRVYNHDVCLSSISYKVEEEKSLVIVKIFYVFFQGFFGNSTEGLTVYSNSTNALIKKKIVLVIAMTMLIEVN